VWARRFSCLDAVPVGSRVVHDHMALGFMTGGSAVMRTRARYDLRAGDVFLVPAGERHGLTAARSPQAWAVGFSPACYAPSELGALLDPFERVAAGASIVIPIPAHRQAHLASLCAELQRETSRDGRAIHVALAQKSLLTLILTEVTRASAVTAGAGQAPTLVGDALRFIERRCLGPISLQAVAAAVRRSPSYVATAVKAATGRTVGQWIIAGRLAEARSRLLHSDELVDVIAERVGYADPTHFIRLFRRTHGATPAAWRARERARQTATS